jgi:hypothetical protein
MKLLVVVAAACLLLPTPSSMFGQETFSVSTQERPPVTKPAAAGQVSGSVICGDTNQPGRFAGVQLIAEKPEGTGVGDMGAFGKRPDFAQAVSVVLGTLMKGSNLSALTGIDGTFVLDRVPPGTYYALAQLPGYQSPLSKFSQAERMQAGDATIKAIESTAEKLVVQANQMAHVELRLERGGSLSGVIRYDDGSPSPGVSPILMARQEDGKWKDLATVPITTDDRGRFRFYGLPSGQYAVRAALPTIQPSMGLGFGSMSMHMNMGDALEVYSGEAMREKDVKPVEVGAGDEVDGVDLVFPISGLHSIAGSVVAKTDNHPVDIGSVVLMDSETKSAVRAAIVDRDGTFHLNYVPNGQYLLQVKGAADAEKSEASEMESDFARMMNRKATKTYGDVEQPLILKSDVLGLVLSVPEMHGEATTAK